MKHKILFALLLPLAASAQTIRTDNPLVGQYKTFSVIGDSYSTFVGKTEPAANAQFYPREGIDVYEPSQTWWMLFQRETGIQLEQNNSYSGGTICNTWWNGADASTVSFVFRAKNLRKADLIVIEGGTNDSNANSPIGSYKYADWTDQDLKSFRPALAKTIDYLQGKYPDSKLVFMLNNGLKADINTSVNEICAHYGVPVLALSGVSKALDHPTYSGMQTISHQLANLLLPAEYSVFSENTTFSRTYMGDGKQAYFVFPLQEGMWTTVCLPFALDADHVRQLFGDEAKLEALTSVDEADEEGVVTMHFTPVEEIEPSQPYLLKPSVSRTTGVIIEDLSVPTFSASKVSQGDVSFQGQLRPTTLRHANSRRYYYVLRSDGTLGMPSDTDGELLGSMHAYFFTSQDTKGLRISIEE